MTEPLHLDLTSNTADIAGARRAVEAHCRLLGFDERSVGDIGLCVNEAIANIIRHAYRGKSDQPIGLDVEIVDRRLRIALRDWGTGIAPGALPDHKVDPLNPGGLGLICLGRLMDQVVFTPQSPGMLLELYRAAP
jgi:serine/threonine-protein kinase RsbW